MKRKLVLAVMLIATLPLLAQHSVTLKWNLSVSTNITGQNIYRAPCTAVSNGSCTTPGTFSVISNVSPSTSSYVDTSVSALQQFVYYVTAVCSTCSPAESIPSNQVLAIIPPDPQPQPPSGLNITQLALLQIPKQSTVAAAWDASGPNQYKLTGTKKLWFFKWNVLLAQGSAPGSKTLKWAGTPIQSAYLQVCDASGCKTRSTP